jgi:hypothetical protein
VISHFYWLVANNTCTLNVYNYNYMLLDYKTNFSNENVLPLSYDLKGRENYHSFIRVSKTFKLFFKKMVDTKLCQKC